MPDWAPRSTLSARRAAPAHTAQQVDGLLVEQRLGCLRVAFRSSPAPAHSHESERLDPRFLARPRRFDHVLRIESPDGAAPRAYLAAKLGGDDAEVERWEEATDGLSLAALAEAVIVRCLGRGLARSRSRSRSDRALVGERRGE